VATDPVEGRTGPRQGCGSGQISRPAAVDHAMPCETPAVAGWLSSGTSIQTMNSAALFMRTRNRAAFLNASRTSQASPSWLFCRPLIAMKDLRIILAHLSAGLLMLASQLEPGLAFNLRDNENNLLPEKPAKRVQPTPVVQILNAGTSGSGVVIGKTFSAYTVATAYHVVSQSSLSEVFVRLEDGSQLKVTSILRPIPEIDFALLVVEKTKEIPVAILPFLDEELWRKVENWPTVYVIGYSANTPDAPESILRSDHGAIESLLSKGEDGYNLLYKARTVVGMSGGGIFGETQLRPFIKNPFAPKKEYFYNTLDESLFIGTAGDDWRDGKWDSAKHHPFQNAFYAKCMASPEWKPEFSGTSEENGLFGVGFAGSENWKQLSQGFQRSSLCKLGANLSYKYKNCKLDGSTAWASGDKPKDPDTFLLLALHGRAERSDRQSKSRTGFALGVYLGSSRIKTYLGSRRKELGLMPPYAYATKVCKVS